MKRSTRTGPSGTPPRPGRPAAAPPALLRDPGDTLDGVPILGEFEDALGVVLFKTLRSVLLWTATPPDRRPLLFTSAALKSRLRLLARARPAPALGQSLETLANLVLAKVEAADPVPVAAACYAVSTWAEEQQAPGTAVEFAQAAALTHPRSANLALHAGELLYRTGRYARAETWFRRTLTLARSTTDPNAYAEASVDLAWILVHDGKPAAARHHLVRALRAARRAALHSAHTRTLHALIRFATISGDLAAAEPFVSAARRLCDPRTSHGASVLLDLAWLRVAQRRIPEATRLIDSVASHAAPAQRQAIAELRAAAASVARGMSPPGAGE